MEHHVKLAEHHILTRPQAHGPACAHWGLWQALAGTPAGSLESLSHDWVPLFLAFAGGRGGAAASASAHADEDDDHDGLDVSQAGPVQVGARWVGASVVSGCAACMLSQQRHQLRPRHPADGELSK